MRGMTKLCSDVMGVGDRDGDDEVFMGWVGVALSEDLVLGVVVVVVLAGVEYDEFGGW